MYNQFFTIKPRISEKNGGSKVVHLIYNNIMLTNSLYKNNIHINNNNNNNNNNKTVINKLKIIID